MKILFLVKKKLKKYIKNNQKQYNELIKNDIRFKKMSFLGTDNIKEYASTQNIEDYIKENKNNNDFKTKLFKLIDERKLKDSDVYNKVGIDRRLFSKIRNEKNYHPSKETVILLGLALELNENEIEDLLESASYSMPKNNKYDLIIRFCFINKIYNVLEVNELLDSNNENILNR